MERRVFLAAAPVAFLANPASASEKAGDPHVGWQKQLRLAEKAYDEASLKPGAGNTETPEEIAADKAKDALIRKIYRTQASSPAGVRVQVQTLLDDFHGAGGGHRQDSEEVLALQMISAGLAAIN